MSISLGYVSVLFLLYCTFALYIDMVVGICDPSGVFAGKCLLFIALFLPSKLGIDVCESSKAIR